MSLVIPKSRSLTNLILFRFLELESSGRRDELRLHYTHDQQIRVETFPFRLADNRWHRLALTLSGNHVTLYVNCSKIYERVIQTLDKQYLAGNYLNLYIGQRNSQSAHFRVSQISLFTFYLWNIRPRPACRAFDCGILLVSIISKYANDSFWPSGLEFIKLFSCTTEH